MRRQRLHLVSAFAMTIEQNLLARGRAEGLVEGLRHSILRTLAFRFPNQDTLAIAERLEAIRNVHALDRLCDLALSCESPAEFMARFVDE
jgi:hypothetical protein